MLSNKKGFTLIELLIVVVIIGILAAIAIPKFASTKEKAYLTAMKSDLRNLVTAEEAYFAEWAQYTSTLSSNAFRTSTGVTLGAITPTTAVNSPKPAATPTPHSRAAPRVEKSVKGRFSTKCTNTQ